MISFKEKSAERIYVDYKRQIDKKTMRLREQDKLEIFSEIESHLFESMASDQSAGEVEKILNAVEKLGDLDHYLDPVVADMLINNAGSSFNPRILFQAFVKNIGVSTKRTMLFLFFGLIYLFVFSLCVAGIAKIFIPEIGLYVGKGNFVIGIVNKAGVTEVLGYWIIPVAFALAFILYLFTTKILRFLALRK